MLFPQPRPPTLTGRWTRSGAPCGRCCAWRGARGRGPHGWRRCWAGPRAFGTRRPGEHLIEVVSWLSLMRDHHAWLRVLNACLFETMNHHEGSPWIAQANLTKFRGQATAQISSVHDAACGLTSLSRAHTSTNKLGTMRGQQTRNLQPTLQVYRLHTAKRNGLESRLWRVCPTPRRLLPFFARERGLWPCLRVTSPGVRPGSGGCLSSQ